MKKTLLLSALTAMLLAPQAADGGVHSRVVSPAGDAVLSGAAQVRIPMRNYAGNGRRRLGENNPLKPPFCETFDNFTPGMAHEDFARYFQTIDANNDNRHWGLYAFSGSEEHPRPWGCCAYLLYPIDEPRADDWLITRAVSLQAGKYYLVSVYAGTYLDIDEEHGQTFEIKAGLYNDVEGLSTLVVPTTTVYRSHLKKITGWFCPDFTAKYYIGIHGNSPAYDDYYNYLFIDNIAVDAPKEGTEPGPVTDVKMVNDPNGTTKVSISFKAPALDIARSTLSDITKITVSRDGNVVKTFTDVTPGQTLEFEDTPANEGEADYLFVATNSIGDGEEFNMTHYAGIVAPEKPEILSFKENDDHSVTLAWSTPSCDLNGVKLNPSAFTYDVVNLTYGFEEGVDEDITANEGTYPMDIRQGQQLIAQMYVRAKIAGKKSEPSATNLMSIGYPFELPYHHTFTMDDYDRYPMLYDGDSEVAWRFMEDEHSDVPSQDGDGGFLAMICNVPDAHSELCTGKIDLGSAAKPEWSFYTYVYADDENYYDLSAIDIATGERIQLGKIELINYQPGWNRIIAPLDALKGKIVSLALDCHIVSHGYIIFDNMTVADKPDIDLSFKSVDNPGFAYPDTPMEITATVTNLGVKTAGAFTVQLLSGDKVVDSATATSLDAGADTQVKLHATVTATSPEVTTFSLAILSDDDQFPYNNTNENLPVNRMASTLPMPQSLTASADTKGNVTLTWEAPDLSKVAAAPVTDSFESYEPFATQPGDWKTIDVDEGLVGGFTNYDQMPYNETPQAWWVMDQQGYDFVKPHTGNRILVAMYNIGTPDEDGIANDDWLITPELYGGPQTVSFWVKALYPGSYETFEVWTSSTGTDLEDFTRLSEADEVVYEEWARMFYTVPDGTRYVAVRYTSDYIMMISLDDFTYTPGSDALGAPAPVGYNVYVNGQLATTAPVTATTFSTVRLEPRDEYMVTAVYNAGESHPATTAIGEDSSIGSIDAGAANGPAVYYNLQGMRVGRPVPGNVYIIVEGNNVEKRVIRR